jgi:thymidine phosphorylase
VRGDVVSNFLRRPDDERSERLVEAAQKNELADEHVAALAEGLARSGLELRRDAWSADLASTGGPSSLSTLLCPLFLRARGLRVPKLGVPGRPAGGIDVLQTIPGFNAALDLEAAHAVLLREGYVHLIADERWAPLDRKLFVYRQQKGSQAVPALVIASILAKKVAAGAVGAGLEVRFAPHGNFGADRSTARVNARRYKAVAGLLDLKPVALLTDAGRPFQPYIGRGEALLALDEVLAGRATGWLADHVRLCAGMADAVAAAVGADTSRPVGVKALQRSHERLLLAHGTSAREFSAQVAVLRSAERTTVGAYSAGRVEYDLRGIRDLLVALQRAEADHNPGLGACPETGFHEVS